MTARCSHDGRAPARPVQLLGEAAGLVLTSGCEEAQGLARAVRHLKLAGVEDVVPAADSLGILVDPDVVAAADVLELAAGLVVDGGCGVDGGRGDDGGRGVDGGSQASRYVELEVCFDGPDLTTVAEHAGLSVEGVVAMLTGAELGVGWLGFMPGFPYLTGLPAALSSVPRLARPRTRVPAGGFALAGGYAGIYPQATPGGWNILGRTGLTLFDPEIPEPAKFSPGDLVRVRAVESLSGADTTDPQPRRPITASGPRRVGVLATGALTLVQDLGRIGVAHLGVPRAGPADPLRHLIANIAVGNAETLAALEITVSGPTLRFGCDAYVALVGDCALHIDGREMPPSTVQRVERGQTVSVGTVRSGLRAYLGISGGLEGPAVLASRSTDTVSGLGPGRLCAGDELDLGVPGRARGRWFDPTTVRPARAAVLRVTAGPEGTGRDAGAFEALLTSDFEVAVESDRVGTRLRPVGRLTPAASELPAAAWPPAAPTDPASAAAAATAAVAAAAQPALSSRAMVTGAVQLPPDGWPVVLGPDHGTVGGYPVVAVVCRSSFPSCGQLRPGDRVHFETAATAGADATTTLARRSVTGWMSIDLGAS